MSSFKDLRIVDNFYQTSSYFPMPTVMISTLAEDGSTSVGSYSLCFPYYIAGKDYYAMVLEARNSSNTAQHLLAGRKTCAVKDVGHFFGYAELNQVGVGAHERLFPAVRLRFVYNFVDCSLSMIRSLVQRNSVCHFV